MKVSENQIPKTIACLLTPQGKGGIGVVALLGPETPQVIERLFKPLSSGSRTNLQYGHIFWEDRIIDEVLLYWPPGEHYAEIHCHGGKALVEEVLKILELPQVKPEAFLDPRRKLADRDLLQKEALLALPLCLSTEGLSMILNQLKGTLRAEIEAILSLVEKREEEARQRLQKLIASYSFGESLIKPAQVLILGAPNVGKSSLLNLLLEKDKALVTSIPGTTRDMVSDLALIEGIPFDFSDSAGIRSTNDLVEKMGIERARAKIGLADFLIGVFEAPSPPDEESWKIVKLHRPKTLVVLNKIDLGLHSFWKEEKERSLPLSCLTKEGLENFKKVLLKKRLPSFFEGPILFTERQHRLVQKALSDPSQSREILLELMG